MPQKYYIEVVHEGLNKRKVISGTDRAIVEANARQQKAAWDEEWRRKRQAEEERRRKQTEKERAAQQKQSEKERAAQQKQTEKERAAQQKQEKKDRAEQRTREAQEAIGAIDSTLQLALGVSHVIRWDDLKDSSPFPKPKPAKPKPPPAPRKPALPPEPQKAQPRYEAPELGILDQLSPARRKAKLEDARIAYQWRIDQANTAYDRDMADWKKSVGDAQAKWKEEMSAYRQLVANQEAEYPRQLREWEQERAEFLQEQADANAEIDRQKDEYLLSSPAGVVAYCQLVLERSQSPDTFPQEFEVDYVDSSQTLIVEYSLPRLEDLPRLKAVKYVQTRDEFDESFLSENELSKLYDSLLYQIALRTVHELYDADAVMALQSVVFNGWVTTIDKGTGQEVTACIMSLQTTVEEFDSIDLAEVDPKTCFKNLKGIGSSKLHSLAAVAPVQTISREDSRFVSSYDVSDALDESYNLAAMDWEDFEHLIREVFEAEFTQGGGEVKVTQASRDGGVDAIAFDPDPIRGGKIVIQAKRYTNVVGVSAVRDLYGTVVNEGATKGILVTTADYGPDAYEFAKGKPLTLLNGNNLLHLLAKHGHKAKIDLKEAKQIQAEREKEEQQRA